VIGMCGAGFVETDMRAHRNPTRMRAIKRATLDLVRRFRSPCPVCAAPGFAVTERLVGLPCSWCGEPTLAIKAEVLSCAACGHRIERLAPATTADPGQCSGCNP
jgi:C4-type Zn-finger protein